MYVLVCTHTPAGIQTSSIQSLRERRWQVQCRISTRIRRVMIADISQPTIVRLGILLLLFDVYLTWARIERATPTSPSLPLSPPPPLPPFPSSTSKLTDSTSNFSSRHAGQNNNLLASQPILVQYLFFLLLCTIETVSFHIPIRALASIRLPWPLSKVVPYYPQGSLISTALLVSSFTKLFPLLLLIWNYDLPSSASAISWAVIINNIAALEILLDCGYVRAAMLAAVGAICRAGAGWVSYADSPLWQIVCTDVDRQSYTQLA